MTEPGGYSFDRPEVNPLIRRTAGETCESAAAALMWAIDPLLHPVEPGLYWLLLPVVTALEAAAERSAGCLMLDADRTTRLEALAIRHAAGNVWAALDQALDALADKTPAPDVGGPTA